MPSARQLRRHSRNRLYEANVRIMRGLGGMPPALQSRVLSCKRIGCPGSQGGWAGTGWLGRSQGLLPVEDVLHHRAQAVFLCRKVAISTGELVRADDVIHRLARHLPILRPADDVVVEATVVNQIGPGQRLVVVTRNDGVDVRNRGDRAA